MPAPVEEAALPLVVRRCAPAYGPQLSGSSGRRGGQGACSNTAAWALPPHLVRIAPG